MMEDLIFIVFSITALFYLGWLLYLIYKFKNRVMRQKAIRYRDLYKVIWQLVKLSIATYLALFFMQIIDTQPKPLFQEGGFGVSYPPLFCLGGLILFSFFSLFLQVILLLALWRLPIIDEVDNDS